MKIREIVVEIKDRLSSAGGIKQVFFVACGGSLTALYPAKYFLEKESLSLRIGYCNSNEFVHATPRVIGKNTVVVLASQRGTTPETIEAVKICKKLHSVTIVLTNVEDSPISEISDYTCLYQMGDAVPPENLKPAMGLKVALELLNTVEGYRYYEDMLSSFSIMNKLIKDIHISFHDQAVLMSKELSSADLIYVLGSGPSWGSAHQESICVFMEMQWINASSIHSGDYFHGPFEMTLENQPFILLVNDGETRELDIRVRKFLQKHNNVYFVLDARELGISIIDANVREYFNPLILTNTLHVFNSILSEERNHPMSIRRYMWKEQY